MSFRKRLDALRGGAFGASLRPCWPRGAAPGTGGTSDQTPTAWMLDTELGKGRGERWAAAPSPILQGRPPPVRLSGDGALAANCRREPEGAGSTRTLAVVAPTGVGCPDGRADPRTGVAVAVVSLPP